MKLEIAVRADPCVDNAVVEKVLVKPADVVEAGKGIILVRRKGEEST